VLNESVNKDTMRNLFSLVRYTLGISIIYILILYVIIKVDSYPYIHNDIKTIPHTQAAVILGAAILKDGSLSKVLQDRVDTAIVLYKNGSVSNILVTGDNSSLAYNEVNPVRTYLLNNGIPDKDIFLDHAGFDTYSSMYRARDIFLTDSITIVTQSFHLPRAIFIAKWLGINAYGFSADNGHHYLLKNYIRELFANVKALGNVFYIRKPKYLGEEIPITGDGRNTD
jgi:SanA protein